MSSKKHAEVLKAADGLSKKSDISLIDVLTLAETSIRSMKSFVDTLDSAVYKEFREIAKYIQNTKTENGSNNGFHTDREILEIVYRPFLAIIRTVFHSPNPF